GVMRGKGRIYRPKNRNVWMLDYFAPPLSGGFERIRESAETDDEKTAKKRLETRLRQVRNAQDGISDFEGPAQKRVTVDELFDALLKDYETRGIKGLGVVRSRLASDKKLRVFFGHRRAIEVTAADVDRYVQERMVEKMKSATINREIELL